MIYSPPRDGQSKCYQLPRLPPPAAGHHQPPPEVRLASAGARRVPEADLLRRVEVATAVRRGGDTLTSSRTRATLVALAVGCLVAFALPLGEVWYKCREPSSEGCVWGKALLPLSLGVCAVFGLLAGTVSYLVVRAVRRRPPR